MATSLKYLSTAHSPFIYIHHLETLQVEIQPILIPKKTPFTNKKEVFNNGFMTEKENNFGISKNRFTFAI